MDLLVQGNINFVTLTEYDIQDFREKNNSLTWKESLDLINPDRVVL